MDSSSFSLSLSDDVSFSPSLRGMVNSFFVTFALMGVKFEAGLPILYSAATGGQNTTLRFGVLSPPLYLFRILFGV